MKKSILYPIILLIMLQGCTQVVTAPISVAGSAVSATIDVAGSTVNAMTDSDDEEQED